MRPTATKWGFVFNGMLVGAPKDGTWADAAVANARSPAPARVRTSQDRRWEPAKKEAADRSSIETSGDGLWPAVPGDRFSIAKRAAAEGEPGFDADRASTCQKR
jgi:hypothetical protein